MKVQFDSNTRTAKNRQCITGGIFYCRDSAGFSLSAINKLSCNLTDLCFEIGNKNIPPKRYRKAELTKLPTIYNIAIFPNEIKQIFYKFLKLEVLYPQERLILN